jgi:hypothetical protein
MNHQNPELTTEKLETEHKILPFSDFLDTLKEKIKNVLYV